MLIDVTNLTEHSIPNGTAIYMVGSPGPDETLAIREFYPHDKSAFAEPVANEEIARFFEDRDDTVLE